MRNVAKSSDENLKTLFGNVAPKAGLSPAIIEKDFWVCWMLDYLFNRSPWTRQTPVNTRPSAFAAASIGLTALMAIGALAIGWE